MYNPIAVANYFIEKAIETGIDVTPMKLLKLVYIAHGWHLAITKGDPLISQGVQAWKYGPVIPDVYHKFKYRRIHPVTELAQIKIDGDYIIPRVKEEIDKDFLNHIWQAYSHYSGTQLSNLTHQKHTPWYEVWERNGGKEKHGAVIPNNLIREHYTEKLNANRRAFAAG